MVKVKDNPFIVSGYVSPEYFCDREKESEHIVNALQNGRNVTLISPRRMGKTGLIKHVFNKIEDTDKSIRTFYIDLLNTGSINDFIRIFAREIVGRMDNAPAKLMKSIATVLKNVRPSFTVDPVTAAPKVEISVIPGQEDSTLKDIFNYIVDTGHRCIIAFDEFQQIAEYPEKNVEATLRSYIQFAPNARFIFSGSKEHMISQMFLSPSRPFYQSTSNIVIGQIGRNEYFDFAAAFFKQQGRQLTEDVFNEFYDRFEGHTWYIQSILNRLWSQTGRLDEMAVHKAIGMIINENEYYYQAILKAYPKGSGRLMSAIAKDGKVKEITSGRFVAKYGLSAASSVKSCLKKLLADDIVYKSDNGYMIYDRFFSEWLNNI